MRPRNGLILLALVLTALAALSYRALRPPPAARPERLSVAETLGGEESHGFARASTPRDFLFPQDHGPHPGYRTEWWYFTGNLESPQRRRYGYQLTFFRIALSPEAPQRASRWAADQIYMAHFALSDVAEKRFHHFERFSRAALGLAGATAEPLRVWLEDWSAEGSPGSPLPIELRAAAGEVAIDLRLESAKPLVLQGNRGLSQKSPEPGNASYYYSLTRLPTAGRIRVGEQSVAVSGHSWLDREWSTSALGPEQAGWDWFALQLDDGRELMFYQMRLKDGQIDPFSSGTLVAADGSSRMLKAHQVVIEVLAQWQSPHSGANYPARWRLRVPAEKLVLEIQPLLADQELQASVRYWEGAVKVLGKSAGQEIRGRGYVELTGYGEKGADRP